MSAPCAKQPSAKPQARDPRKLGYSAAIYAVANVLSGALPFLLLPVLTRVLTPGDFGHIAVFVAVQGFLAPIIGMGTRPGIVKQVVISRHDVSGSIGASLLITASSALVTAFLLMHSARLFVSLTGLPLVWLLLAVVAAAAQFAALLGLSCWQARGHPLRAGVTQVIQALINTVLALLLVVHAELGWEGRVAAQTIAPVLTAGLVLTLLAAAGDLGLPTWSQVSKAFWFGLPLVASGLASATQSFGDRLLLANMLDLEQVGFYTAALQLAMLLGFVIQASTQAYSPWLYNELAKGERLNRKALVRGSYAYFIALGVLALAFGFAAPLLALVLGEKFRSSVLLIPYLAFGVAMGGMYSIVAGYLFFSERTGWLSAVTTFSAAVSVVVTIVLVRVNGTVGAAQAFVFSQAVLFFATWWCANKALPMPWSEPLRCVALPAFARRRQDT